MQTFDLIVIGGGSGLSVSSTMAAQGWKVAIIESGPFGGTCLNRGCIPSKMLIHVADIVEQIKLAKQFNIKASYSGVHFKQLIERVSNTVDQEAKDLLNANKQSKNITVFRGKAKFIDKKIVKVGKSTLSAKKIIIAAGGRPFIPPIPGLQDVPYLTSKEALRLTKLPKSMTIIGGGVIAVELAHFFGTLGTKVTILERGPGLLSRVDKDLSSSFTELFSQKYSIRLHANANSVSKTTKGIKVNYEDTETGKKQSIVSEQLLIAVGRKPNTDELKLADVGYQLSKRGYIETNQYLETTVDGVWALGDIAGNWAYKHSANFEAEVIVRNFFLQKKEKALYPTMPYAIFSSPQLAGFGKTEQELINEKTKYHAYTQKLKQTGMGMALMDEYTFMKVLVNETKTRILGCHILGHEASTLIHEVLPIARKGGKPSDIAQTIHVHPALSEIIQRGFAQI